MENNTRTVALQAICSVVLEKKSLSAFVYPEEVSALTKSLVFGTIRFYHQLNDIVSGLLKHSLKKEDLDIHCLMLLGAYQILHSNVAAHASIFETVNVTNELDKPWAKKLVNAILREIDRQKSVLQKQIHYSHPTWLLKKIKQYYPNDFEQIFQQNNTQAPMTLRVHPDFHKQSLLAVAPQAQILDKAVNVYAIQDFDKGACFVQDASAQLAAPLLDPKNDDLILDACCAPGGKTTHLSELAPQSKIIALDNNPDRLKRVQENIDRFKIKNITLLQGKAQNQDWWDGKLFDKILLDAPCSATGVIRRHPDIKLLRKPKDISALVDLQKDILNNLWMLLKPGGTLLYATCSILKNENETQIAQFLQTHDEAIEEEITLDWGYKATHGKQQIPCYEFDGFYYAKLKKK
ncbi:Ribosomal RNA small subunit methyltransferase B [Bathymodiolus thermophilus thioautotrophic gill symbiont]|uniref:16S rRNA (cytosine(967)-C(5))-methyltransferase n=1 Tax=Bathymodiolus thermophilus thioautotrophic gill symbiont TaxID=2360 RepID=A0A8H8XCH1_9GAMM|nr:16S rRNA (cytosine(967)-C(5))-methyltransferase RsmB [Bathymodiolus thermophilus thioautotrophic gill symbiont]CAB5503611.1 16S rRNA (cytosine(967)-C(5))-methyltransferase (EC [Bathymodiolus thermophilus thioautotrophic gill symbiont]SGZ95918.1 Ribosomal RNA small subunit methyltransferase B [Bathymodiolus thermophilus thioautotrophic gill symbiont]